MQKVIVLLAVFFVVGYLYFVSNKSEFHPAQETTTKTILSPEVNQKEIKKVQSVKKSVFVPYWHILNTQELSEYDTLIYFGVSATEDGVNTEDQGFVNMPNFIQNSPNRTKYVTLRMLNTDTNLKILDNPTNQDELVKDIIAIAQSNGFDGIVLDLELSVIPFSNVTQNINLFVEKMATEVKNNNLYFAMTIYGDTYYRSRPYDLKSLSEHVDEVMIMSYDFHKSRGEPGPNFPFQGRKTYGYDFQQMISDFTQDVDTEKITVIFGLYGYDWTLGKEGKPLTAAKSLSLADMQAEFVQSCNYKSCNVSTDPESAENNVTYIDEDGYTHSVWFEDEESVETKLNYLKEQGIGSISYWTWGYW